MSKGHSNSAAAYGSSGTAQFSTHAGRKPFSGGNFGYNYYNNNGGGRGGSFYGRFEPVYRGGSRKVRIKMKENPLTAQGQ